MFETMLTLELRQTNGQGCQCRVYVEWALDGHWKEQYVYVCRSCKNKMFGGRDDS